MAKSSPSPTPHDNPSNFCINIKVDIYTGEALRRGRFSLAGSRSKTLLRHGAKRRWAAGLMSCDRSCLSGDGRDMQMTDNKRQWRKDFGILGRWRGVAAFPPRRPSTAQTPGGKRPSIGDEQHISRALWPYTVLDEHSELFNKLFFDTEQDSRHEGVQK